MLIDPKRVLNPAGSMDLHGYLDVSHHVYTKLEMFKDALILIIILRHSGSIDLQGYFHTCILLQGVVSKMF